MIADGQDMRAGAQGCLTSDDADLPVLHLRGVTKYFGGVQALNGAEFALHRQEIVAIVGDNGAGKSTMVKIISGVHPPDSGEILMSGQRVTMQSPLRARNLGIETVFQDLALVNTTDVVSNLFLGREIVRGPFGWVLDKGRMTEQTREILGRLKISIPDLHAPVGQLSGGQRQAVAVCRAVTWGTKIVLMDEPTAALGVKESQKVLDLILRMKELGISVVIVVHNLEHVFSVADRIVVMRAGRVIGALRRNETSREAVVGMITGAAA
jgi:ABC-type sugar transport system ATPase subunit